jgi:cation diffusion facilitator CzcD-associated flavoprotein CzcO
MPRREFLRVTRTPRSGTRPTQAVGRQPQVAILGAGIGGLCVAIQLKRAGIESFTIYEKSDGVGGTWRDNTYPGAACDVPSHLYSFSFAPNPDWSKRFADQPEILSYLDQTVDQFAVRPHLRTNTAIASMRWDEAARQWELTATDGQQFIADVVVSGLGQLNAPLIPEIDNVDVFGGDLFHSARWNHDIDLTGKNVAVIGNGPSAAQLVPPVANIVAQLTIFQRSANWFLPRNDKPYSLRTKTFFRKFPAAHRLYRARIFNTLELTHMTMTQRKVFTKLVTAVSSRFMRSTINDPVTQAKCTPDYPIGCKRVVLCTDFFKALNRGNVELNTEGIDRFDETGIVTTDGKHHDLDVVVFATGFASTNFLAPIEVFGVGGVSLHERWANGAEAHFGVAVSGFPNFFMVYGPNTNLGHNSIMFMIECQASLIVRALRSLATGEVPTINVSATAMARHNEHLQQQLAETVWLANCTNWYKNAQGKVINNWPGTARQYQRATRQADLAALSR